MWIALLIKLAAVVGEIEQTQGAFQSIRAARKAARLTSQTSEIMSQFRIIGFHGKSVRLARRDLITTEVIPKPSIGIKAVAVIPFRLGCLVDYLLNGFLGAIPDHGPTQQTARFAVNDRQNVDSVFLSPMKVYNSSSSASFTSCGIGGFGKASA